MQIIDILLYICREVDMEITYTLDEIAVVAEQVLKFSKHKIFLFYGDMGVGKTTLIKEIAKKLGVLENLNSPSFSIINEYIINERKLFHFDFYRLKNENEFFELGIEEYIDSGHWCLIEWPQKAESSLPDKTTKITIKINKNRSRTINICQ